MNRPGEPPADTPDDSEIDAFGDTMGPPPRADAQRLQANSDEEAMDSFLWETPSEVDSTGAFVSVPAPDEAPEPEQPFVLSGLIGRGGFGEVFSAVQTALGRIVAVKRLRPNVRSTNSAESTEGPSHEDLFRQEAVVTALLEHPNIVPVHEFGADQESGPILAMKLVRGESWDAILARDRAAMAYGDFLARHIPILVSVVQAVAFAHSQGIMHRDIKPGQVMVGEFGEVVLTDWGMAVIFDEQLLPAEVRDIPQTKVVPRTDTARNPAGTPAYMAPEQTEQTGWMLGPWTDIYLLGGTLFNLLTGTPPHTPRRDMGILEVFARARSGSVESPRERNPDFPIPSALNDLCVDAMKPDPRERTASANIFLEGLRDYLTGADRRRESIALTRQARAQEAGWTGNYSRLSATDSLIDQALTLWPDNTDARALRQSLLVEYARSAVDRGDLSLARVQAERMTPSEERDDILNEVAVLEKLKDREEGEAVEWVEERDEAVVARLRAEALAVEAMVRLIEWSPSAAADQAGDLAGYYGPFPAAERDGVVIHGRARAFAAMGRAAAAAGRVEPARLYLGQASECQRWLAAHRKPPVELESERAEVDAALTLLEGRG